MFEFLPLGASANRVTVTTKRLQFLILYDRNISNEYTSKRMSISFICKVKEV